jgi:hypothetical protein
MPEKEKDKIREWLDTKRDRTRGDQSRRGEKDKMRE